MNLEVPGRVGVGVHTGLGIHVGHDSGGMGGIPRDSVVTQVDHGIGTGGGTVVAVVHSVGPVPFLGGGDDLDHPAEEEGFLVEGLVALFDDSHDLVISFPHRTLHQV